MSILDSLSVSWGHLLTFVFGCWYGARWVRRHNVVMNRSRHRALLNDLNDTTNALARLTGDYTSFVMTPDEDDEESVVEFIDVYVEEEGDSDDDSDIRVVSPEVRSRNCPALPRQSQRG